MFPSGLPRTGSHEGTGTVVQVGSKVDNFKKGDRVMSGIPRNQCQSCVNCKGQLNNLYEIPGGLSRTSMEMNKSSPAQQKATDTPTS